MCRAGPLACGGFPNPPGRQEPDQGVRRRRGRLPYADIAKGISRHDLTSDRSRSLYLWVQESDIAAIARAREGHGDAYRELVERHGRALFRLAFRMTGRVEDAEDVVQETLLRAFRHLHRYETRASFATWLHRIAANCALDVIRLRKRQRAACATDCRS